MKIKLVRDLIISLSNRKIFIILNGLIIKNLIGIIRIMVMMLDLNFCIWEEKLFLGLELIKHGILSISIVSSFTLLGLWYLMYWSNTVTTSVNSTKIWNCNYYKHLLKCLKLKKAVVVFFHWLRVLIMIMMKIRLI